MEIAGHYRIAAPPAMVWRGLNDPELLRACIPGCERLERTGPADFTGAVTLRIGPMKATFQGKMSLTDQEPPFRCTLTGEGQGGAAGFAKGEAVVTLSSEEGGTALSYTAKADVAGKLGQAGQFPIDGAARQMADQFFAAFSAALAPIAPSLPEASGPQAAMPKSVNPAGVSSMVWMTGLVAVAAILILMFTVVM